VGNEDYVRENQSFGLTTLEDRHSRVEGDRIRFSFRGKSGRYHEVDVQDPRLAAIVKQCQDLPGQELFQYLDLSGSRHDIASDDVNAYLQESGGKSFTAKDFRTWMGTVQALDFLLRSVRSQNVTQIKKTVARCIQAVAHVLGNTPAVCRQSYIHPGIFTAYEAGELESLVRGLSEALLPGLSMAEQATVRFLRNRALQSAPTL
jgi:DNA topoisomerase-1